MKIVILIIIASLNLILTFGQSKLPIDTLTGKVLFRKIIELDTSYKSEQIFSITKEWLSTNNKKFNRSNSDKNYSSSDVFLELNEEILFNLINYIKMKSH